jgi:hypothetical protein
MATCPIGQMYLSRFFAQELCIENLTSYHDIRSFLDYSTISNVSKDELREKAKKLEQFYFEEDSLFEGKYPKSFILFSKYCP